MAEVTQESDNKCTVIFKCKEESPTSYSDIQGLFVEYVKSKELSFINKKAYLIMNASSWKHLRKVLLDANSYNYDPAVISFTPNEVFFIASYNVCAINTAGDLPIVYHEQGNNIDKDSFKLMYNFSRLSWTKGVYAEEEGTDFMLEYISKYYDLNPTTERKGLFLEESRNALYVIPEHINTDEVKTLFSEYLFPEPFLQESTEYYPLLSIILYKSGLTYINKITPLYNDMFLPNVLVIMATSKELRYYIIAETDKDFEKVKQKVLQDTVTTLVATEKVCFSKVLPEDVKEYPNVSV